MNMQGEHFNYNQPRRSRIVLALFIILIGAAILLKTMALPFFPSWLFSWPVLFVGIGLYLLVSRRMRDGSGLVFLLIGGFFLADDIIPGISLHRFIWPVIIISVGLMILLTPRRKKGWKKHWGSDWARQNDVWQTGMHDTQFETEDVIDIASVFGGAHRTIVSKNFRGGEIVNVMAGAEINCLQADINGVVVLEITQVMGGIKLTVPAHWQIQNDITSVFATVDDRREKAPADPNKVLVLKGSSVFAGIDIR
jgi:predicted membrane protein